MDHPHCPVGKVVRKLSRSEIKRKAVIDAARESFLEKGYGESSMDDIAQRAGVSKRTVYNHFPGKDALFGAVIQSECDQTTAMTEEHVDCCNHDVADTLKHYARNFLSMIYAPDGISLFRTIVAEAERFPELGNIFFLAGVCPAQVSVQAYIEKQMAAGNLRKADPEVAASMFFSMVRGDMHYKLLLCYQSQALEEEINSLIDNALELWMRAYAPA